jgi:hypothetical protein
MGSLNGRQRHAVQTLNQSDTKYKHKWRGWPLTQSKDKVERDSRIPLHIHLTKCEWGFATQHRRQDVTQGLQND